MAPLRAALARRPWLLLAVLAYVPLVLSDRGRVGADTKAYLYLDPGRLLSRAWSMWDPDVGLGTVTHQTIGYLFPMGPYYWLLDAIGLPDWLAQRLWLGSILFLAGAGVLFMMRTLGRTGLPALVAAVAYMLTPYSLSLAARLSVILLPFAGLPWLIALVVRAGRRGGWRDAALFAIAVQLIGGVNATALLFAGLGPALWLVVAAVSRELSFRRAAATALRIGVLTVVTSLWWISGLLAQGRYGIDILRYTETAEVVSRSSVAPEVARGLGYWFFYGGDRLGPWIEAGTDYTQRLWLIVVTYALPILACLALGVVRWRHRAYFVLLAATGFVIAVGAHPWADPSLVGAGWKRLLLGDAGLALRSTPRALPLLALGTAVGLGVGVEALARSGPRVSRLARPVGLAVIALAVAGLPPLYTGGMVADNLQRPEDVPAYWTDAAAHLDSRGDDTRVLEIPGSDFASYRWGNTVDPITPGLIDRAYAARELIPYGSPPSANLLNALDRRLQEGWLDAEGLAPVARLMGVGDIVVRSDLQYERYRTPRPRTLWDLVVGAPGLGEPEQFGGDRPNVPVPEAPLLDDEELATPPSLPHPPQVAVFPVENAVPLVRTAPAVSPLVVAGDGDGLVEAAEAGLLAGDELVLYSASLAGDPDGLAAQLDRGAALLVTDSNRRRGQRWTTVRDVMGYTEPAGEEPLVRDLTDNRLPLFADAGDDTRTVAEHRGVHAQATAYGNPISLTPEFRAANAIDGDLRTAWRVGAFDDVRGERLVLSFDEDITADRVRLLQLIQGDRNRTITDATLRFVGRDGRTTTQRVRVDDTSLTPPGQDVLVAASTFRRLEIRIDATDEGDRVRWNDLSAVGFTEIDVDGRRVDEVIRVPTDLLAAAGTRSLDHPLTFLFSRSRIAPSDAVRSDEEVAMVRAFWLPTAREFALLGRARLSARAADDVLDRLLGLAPADEGGVDAVSSRRLPGAVDTRATQAIDGDASTFWSPPFEDVADWIEYRVPAPVTFDAMSLAVVADGRHSVPTRIRVDADGLPAAIIDVPPVADRTEPNAVVSVPLRFPPITGTTLRFTLEATRDVTTINWFSRQPIHLPVGIAELGVAGLSVTPPSGTFSTGCRDDLVSIDGDPVAVRVTGTVEDALRRLPLELRPCGGTVALRAGDHLVRTGNGIDLGVDVDRVVFQSDAGGAAPAAVGEAASDRSDDAPAVEVTGEGRDRVQATVTGAVPGEPFWLVLGQSHNEGWRASAEGRSLGDPTLVNGYANGWLIIPDDDTVSVSMRWTPQGITNIALAVSAAGLVVCLVLALRRQRRVPQEGPEGLTRAPVLVSGGFPRSPAVSFAVALVAAAVTGAVIGPWPETLVAAGAVGIAAYAACRWRYAAVLLTVGPAVLLGISGAYILGRQAVGRPTAALEWPAEQGVVHPVAFTAVVLLVLGVTVSWLRHRPPGRASRVPHRERTKRLEG